MIVTDITKQKSDPNRVSVFIDEQFAFGMNLADLMLSKINKGDELSEERYEHIIREVIGAKSRERAFRAVSRGRKTERELFDILNKDGYRAAAEDTIELVKQYGYVNDFEYACDYIAEQARKGYGWVKINSELSRKGVDRETVRQALDKAVQSGEFDEEDIAKRVIEQKTRRKADMDMVDNNIEYKERKKLENYLLNRGFSYGTVGNVLRLE